MHGPEGYEVPQASGTEATTLGQTGEPTAQAPETAQPARYERIHFIGGAVLRGVEHSDPATEERIAELQASQARIQEQFEELFETLPNRNEQYAAGLEVLRDQLTNDFGEAAGETPVKVLSPKNFAKLCNSTDSPFPPRQLHAYVRDNLIAIRAGDAYKKLYGDDYVTAIGLHEGAHAARTDVRDVYYSKELPAHAQAGGSSEPEIGMIEVGGMIEIALDANGTEIEQGYFWEEGLVDEYRVRTSLERGLGFWPADYGEGLPMGEGVFVDFAGNDCSDRATHINSDTGALVLPSRYLYAAGIKNGLTRCEVSWPGMAAYGIRLLDEQSPGLYNDMLQSRVSSAARERAKAAVNSISPGLYDELARLPYSATGFSKGLARVVEVLGEENRRVRRL